MKKLLQTRLGFPDGNCFPTCLACLLDYDDPEAFLQIQLFYDKPDVQWMAELQKYLIQKHGVMIWNLAKPEPGQYYLRGVRTEAGIDHETIWLDGQLYHDPNRFSVATWSDGSVHPYDQQHLVPVDDERTFLDAFGKLFDSREHFDRFWAHDQATGPFLFAPERIEELNKWHEEVYAEWLKSIAEEA